MAMGVRGAIASAVGLVLLTVTASSAAADGMLSGDVPSSKQHGGGVALVWWSGGSVEELEVVADQRECTLRAAWLAAGGRFVGYIVGAPEFANAEWSTLVGFDIEARALLLVCASAGLGSCPSDTTISEYGEGAVGTETTREALEEGLEAYVPLPHGVWTEVPDPNATLDSPPSVVWELVVPDGAVVARFWVQDYGSGWLPVKVWACYFT